MIENPRRLARHAVALAALRADRATLEPVALSAIVESSQNLVRWEIEAATASGPYTLTTCFPNARLVQIFDRASAALVRQVELQEMLVVHAQRSFLTRRQLGGRRRSF